jgi:hypothetical protein
MRKQHPPTGIVPGTMRERRTLGLLSVNRAQMVCSVCHRPVHMGPRGAWRHGVEDGYTVVPRTRA